MTDATVVTPCDRFHAVAADAPPAARVPVEVQTEVVDPYDAYRRARRERDVVMAVRHTQSPHVGVQFHPESILTEHGKPMVQNFPATCRRWDR